MRFESWGTAFRDWKIGGISKKTMEQPFKNRSKRDIQWNQGRQDKALQKEESMLLAVSNAPDR